MKKYLIGLLSLMLCLSACTNNTVQETINEESIEETVESKSLISESDITVNETLENTNDGEHVIEVSGSEESYSNIAINKTGESSDDEADFYGENSAVFATDSATLNLSEIIVKTNGTHANAVFSYGEGTTVNISDSVIETSGNCSGGIMTTGNGTMNATNLNIHTTGNSSAAIRSDRGGGTVTVNGGSYVTDGKGSPVIYSTADITVNDAYMESTSSQGVVVEGQNSVTLNDVELIADNNSKNSDKSDYYQAVMIYQSMSGDADEGLASFTMNNSSLLNKQGDIFFVNNTVATINLNNVDIANEDKTGLFLRAQAAGWGNSGSNGGHVTLNAYNQTINQDILVDEVSTLNMYLKDNSVFNGSIENSGEVYVEIESGSKWVLTSDTYITSLTCEEDEIDLNGYKLYVNGVEYTENTASSGEAIVVEISSSNNGFNESGMPGNNQELPAKPDGNGQESPAKPDGNGPKH